ncbi:hypothetical protein K6Y31_16575 [Motilimonas cestriensis]|uniref:Uncharacterized protein n=1 Tax=Motilimonas cestriensis TaxID=2742685 RepID=A0ABS8WE56_9GAMM|nr:hypothetical protein [Motilimonas cestriensis]MCE2596412.1 hypothetical protein [Motilimonas cestriensis]
MAERINSVGKVLVGDYFESCNFHPCLCIELDEAGRNIEGVSLIDGRIISCSVENCGIRKLTVEEAIKWKLSGPQELGDIKLDDTQSWWKIK